MSVASPLSVMRACSRLTKCVRICKSHCGPRADRDCFLRQRKAFRSVARQAKQRRRRRTLSARLARILPARGGGIELAEQEVDRAPSFSIGADPLLELLVQCRDSGVASFEGSILVDDGALESSDGRAALVELRAPRGELAAHALDVARRRHAAAARGREARRAARRLAAACTRPLPRAERWLRRPGQRRRHRSPTGGYLRAQRVAAAHAADGAAPSAGHAARISIAAARLGVASAKPASVHRLSAAARGRSSRSSVSTRRAKSTSSARSATARLDSRAAKASAVAEPFGRRPRAHARNAATFALRGRFAWLASRPTRRVAPRCRPSARPYPRAAACTSGDGSIAAGFARELAFAGPLLRAVRTAERAQPLDLAWRRRPHRARDARLSSSTPRCAHRERPTGSRAGVLRRSRRSAESRGCRERRASSSSIS